MGKSSPKVPVFAYKMTITYGLCHGVVDWVHRLIVREKVIWNGRKCGPDALFIDAPKAFGGHLEEGGVQGFAYFQNGTLSQKLHSVVAGKHGGTPDDRPGYRGISTMTFAEAGLDPTVEGSNRSGGKGNPGFDGPGFYWTSGSPYLPGIWITLQRIPRPFLLEKAYIFRETGEGEPPLAQNYCFAITWDEEIGTPGPQPEDRSWVLDVQDYDGDGVDDSRADHFYTLIAKFCDHLTSIGEGASEITLHFFKGAGGINDDDLDIIATGVPASWNNPAFVDSNNFAKVGPFLASSVSASGGYGGINLPKGTNNGNHSKNSSFFAGTSGLFDKVLEDHDEGGNFSYVFLLSEHAEDDRWDKFDTGLAWKYGVGLAGNEEMKQDYRRIASDFRTRCIKFRMLAYDEFHLVSQAINANKPDTTSWDVLFMISGAESRAHSSFPEANAAGWYGPYIDVLNSSFSWHFWQSRFHGFSAQSEALSLGYQHDFSNIYSDPDTNTFYEAHQNYPDAFDVGGGGEAWIEYFFATRLFADYYDANPIHVIVECLTNDDWGLGYPISALNMAAFTAAAKLMCDERFGVSFLWREQDTIENIVTEVLDHIDAALFINPATGLFDITPIRDDYDPNTLEVFGPHNMTVRKSSTRIASEAVNEITVSWTNPENEQEETVTLQDQGAIVAAGGLIRPETRNYYMVRRRDLASQLCARDTRSAAAPITTMEIEADRRAWEKVPGGLIKVFYPELSIDELDPLVMRITGVEYGEPGDSTIRISLSEDIFSLAPQTFETPVGSDPISLPVLPTEADDIQPMTLPYFFAFNTLSGGALAEYPDTMVGLLVEESDVGSETFNLFGPVVNPAGETPTEDLGNRFISAKGLLPVALAWEAETTVVDLGPLTNGAGPQVGGFILIGDPATPENERELCLIKAFTSGWVLKRGVLDTVPRVWPAGTEFWVVSIDNDIEDPEIRADGQVLTYVVQVVATDGVLPLASITPAAPYTATDRPHLPLRPANVAVNGLTLQPVFYTSVPATVDVTWADRNRETENAVVLAWDDAGVPAEVGQTVEVEVYDEADTLLHTFTGLTGGSAALDAAEFSTTGVGHIRVFSVRDGLRSFQYYKTRVDIRANSGYGKNYGDNYGG